MRTGTPIYQQMANLIREKIEQGTYSFGDKIASERELSETYKINRMTTRKAVDLLVQDGLLKRVQGKGTFVSFPKMSKALSGEQRLDALLFGMGLKTAYRVLYAGTQPAGFRAGDAFGVGMDTPVYYVLSLCYGGGEPFAIEEARFPLSLVDNPAAFDFSVHSAEAFLAQQGVALTHTEQRLEIIRVRDPWAHLLNVADGANIFMLENRRADEQHSTKLLTRVYMAGDKFTFSATLR